MFKLLSRDKRVWGAQGDEQILRTTEVRDTRLSLPFTGGAGGSRTEAQETTHVPKATEPLRARAWRGILVVGP